MSIGELPLGWIETTLGEILELKYGKSLPERDRDGVGFPVYGSNGAVGLHSIPLVNSEGLIIGRKGSFGEIRISKVSFFPIDTTYYVDKFHNQPIKYWFYQLRFLPLTTLNRSTAIPGLNRDDAYDQTINFPSLAEQQQITVKLDELLAQVDSLKTRLDAIPKILKRFRQSVLAAAVSGKLTEDWRGSSENSLKSFMLSDLMIESMVGLVRSANEQFQDKVDKVAYLKMNNIDNFWGLNFGKNVFVSCTNAEKQRYLLKKGDWLFNTRNSAELVGKSCVWNSDSDFIFNNNILRVVFNKELTTSDFIEIWFKSPLGQQNLNLIKSATTNVAAIYQKALMQQIIELPNFAEQLEIVGRVANLFAYADQIEQRVKDAQSRVNHLTQSILAKAFRGELTAEWREQNPDLISGENSAEALLARIQAEREANSNSQSSRKRHKFGA